MILARDFFHYLYLKSRTDADLLLIPAAMIRGRHHDVKAFEPSLPTYALIGGQLNSYVENVIRDTRDIYGV